MRHRKNLLALLVTLGILAPLYGQPAGPSKEERKLMSEKLATAQQELRETLALSRDIKFEVLAVLPAYQRCVDAGMEFYKGSSDRVKLLEGLVEVAKGVEKEMEARLRNGGGRQRDVYAIRYMRLDAELRLLRETKKASKEERKLMKQKLETAQMEVAAALQESRNVKFDLLGPLHAHQRCVNAGLEFYQEATDRVKLLEDFVEVAKGVDKQMEDGLRGGAGRRIDANTIRYMRLDAELRLLREKKKAK
jgi:hypothetical protein